jgi:tRNA (guanine37-N1)-methyltransferase
MRIDIVTIFPKMFEPVLGESIIKRAQAKGKVALRVHDLREFTADKHRKVDDRPFGGGAGMVMSAQPIFDAVDALRSPGHQVTRSPGRKKGARVILLCPQGKKFDQKAAKRLSREKHLILICGHYEGIDERVRLRLADEELSIGDYVLTGGELPAMVLVDAVVRLIPGVLGDKNSLNFESFEGNLLEYPQYTRPADFRGMKVPSVLTGGDHEKIAAWRRAQAVARTQERRPDLLIHPRKTARLRKCRS